MFRLIRFSVTAPMIRAACRRSGSPLKVTYPLPRSQLYTRRTLTWSRTVSVTVWM